MKLKTYESVNCHFCPGFAFPSKPTITLLSTSAFQALLTADSPILLRISFGFSGSFSLWYPDTYKFNLNKPFYNVRSYSKDLPST